MEKIAASVEGIEAQAEKKLEEARNRANEIMLKAREECRAITATELPLDETKATGENITLPRARDEANRIMEDSSKKVAEIKHIARKRSKAIVISVVMKVTGVEA